MENKPLNAREIASAISRFKSNRVATTTIGQYRSIFDKIDSQLCFPGIILPIDVKFHRMRINTDGKVFNSLSDLWCPPKEMVRTYGRLNSIGEQVLYTSGGGHTCLNEINPPPGSMITCVEFVSVEAITAIEIGMHNKFRKDPFFDRYWKRFDYQLNRHYKGDRRMLSLDNKFKDFLASEFTKSVFPTQEDLYKRTIAIANSFFSSPDIECIIYPSVKSRLKDANFAIPEEVARRVLKVNRIDVLEIQPGQIRPFKNLTGSYESVDFKQSIVYTEPRLITEWATFHPFEKNCDQPPKVPTPEIHSQIN